MYLRLGKADAYPLLLAPPVGPVATRRPVATIGLLGSTKFFCFKPRSVVKLHPSIVTSEVNCGLASEVRSITLNGVFSI